MLDVTERNIFKSIEKEKVLNELIKIFRIQVLSF